MLDLATLTAFFGWMTLINLVIIAFTAISLLVLKDTVGQIHMKLFDVSQAELNKIYFKYIACYKILFIVFNLVPYVALLLVG